MLSAWWVLGASGLYLLLLFAVAYFADWRAQQGRSVIANPWTYALVHGGVLHRLDLFWQRWAGCIGWRLVFADLSGANTLAMVLGWMVLRKMIRIAKAYRITSIADFIGSRYGKSPALAGWVTLIAVVGIVPYIALQLKAVSAGYALLTTVPGAPALAPAHWSQDSTFYMALALAGSPWCLVPGIWTRPSAMRGWWPPLPLSR
jgi:hypothetical protein